MEVIILALFKKKTQAPAEDQVLDAGIAEGASQEDIDAQVQSIMEKYDRESNVRLYQGLPRKLVRYLCAAFSVYAMYISLVAQWDDRVKRASFVGLIVLMAFIIYPRRKGTGKKKPNYIPWYDIVLGLLGAAAYFYFVFNSQELIQVRNTFSKLYWYELVLGAIGILITLEACRRSVGIPIVIVCSAFVIYALTQKPINLNIYNFFYTLDNGVLGTPIKACMSFIVLFVIFGAFLEKTGIAQFFIDLANSIAGASAGGPAKVAVISSALCGMVSGSSVGNTVTTGSITIPLMKKTGYKPEFAGAVEAAASTGGQIMPPIMGAAAFLMVEYVNMPGVTVTYGYIALRAILPACLYFTGIFLMVHLEAKKLGLTGLSREELPKFLPLILRSGFLLLPLIGLVYLIITTTMAKAAIIATGLAVAVSNLKKSPIPSIFACVALVVYTFLPTSAPGWLSWVLVGVTVVCCVITMAKKDAFLNFSGFVDALEAGAKNTLTVGVACATAGVIAGVITTTGIGSKLITMIVGFSGGHLFVALVLTMITCIILGMGVPTTANYVIMATTCAPILIQMNVPSIAAHMFVFYFGIVADITPPVALAAYAGSAIAGSNPMKTGLNATRLAIAAFIVPYIFVLNPAMVFVNTTAWEVVLLVVTSFVGMFGVSIGLEGHICTSVAWPLRILVIAGGLCLIYPGTITDGIGLVVVALIVFYQYSLARRQSGNDEMIMQEEHHAAEQKDE